VIVMRAVARAYHQRIWPAPGQHRAEVGEDRAVDTDGFARAPQAQRIAVAKPHEIDHVPAVAEQLSAPGPGTAMAGADHRHAPLATCRHDAGSPLVCGQTSGSNSRRKPD
jgi:hypothetical protein